MNKKPIVLIIRDGWGQSPNRSLEEAKKNGDATILADTPFHDRIEEKYPSCLISCSGEDVGLPTGQMGNSEVGHLNLGAGRIVYQDLTRIDKCISENKLKENKNLKDLFSNNENSAHLHLIGLISDGGVHSSQNHIIEIARLAKKFGIEKIYLHAITDGRDTSPTSGAKFIEYCEGELATFGAEIATVIGRYYAMDRDNRAERTKIAWDAIVNRIGKKSKLLASEVVEKEYKNGKTDEFIQANILNENVKIKKSDIVIFCNFRADRARQLSRAFLDKDFNEFDREGWVKTKYATLTQYDKNFDCPVIFQPKKLENCIGEYVSNNKIKQLRISETEKYPHVTYFFNGGVEKKNPGEDRIIIPSPKVATYDLKPEMSARELTDTVIPILQNYGLIILNFPNPDMVGHTGSVKASIKAVETVDKCLSKITETVLSLDGKMLITADHGNCELMIKKDRSPHTAHTTNTVKCYYIAKNFEKITLRNGILADIAPTLLQLLDLEKPKSMSGKSLIK